MSLIGSRCSFRPQTPGLARFADLKANPSAWPSVHAVSASVSSGTCLTWLDVRLSDPARARRPATYAFVTLRRHLSNMYGEYDLQKFVNCELWEWVPSASFQEDFWSTTYHDMDLCALSTMHTSGGSIAQPTILLSTVSRVRTLLFCTFFVFFPKNL